MTQEQKQVKKVKKYRILKVVFYSLGLPLFIITLFLNSTGMLGQTPYNGTSNLTGSLGLLTYYESMVTSPALYGMWLGVALWLTVSIIHIILSKTVKNRRVRMFTVLVCIFVFMFGGTLLMDTVLTAKLATLKENAPIGVTVDDYKTQLSYYRTFSTASRGGGKDRAKALVSSVSQKLSVYNVGYTGSNSGGVAVNTENKPITYYNIIDDEGVQGVDISFRQNSDGFYELAVSDEGGRNDIVPDGDITKEIEGNQLVRLRPNAEGMLEINGKVYSHYFWVNRGSMQGQTVYIWYTKEMMSDSFTFDHATGGRNVPTTDGVYGPGVYTLAGMLNDGWIFGLDNTMRLLEDYYEAQAAFAELEKDPTVDVAEARAEMISNAIERRELYYTGQLADKDGNFCDPWIQTLYQQEVDYKNRFSLPQGRLDALVAQVGALLGDNHLFDYLLKNASDLNFSGWNLGEVLGPILEQLSKGMSLKDLLTQLKSLISSLNVDNITNIVAQVFNVITGRDDINDIYIMLNYKNDDAFGNHHDHLYLAIFKDNGAGQMGTADDVLLDIDFTNAVAPNAAPGNPDSEYVFDLDNLSKFLTNAINNALTKYGNIKNIIDKVVNLLAKLNILVKTIDVNGAAYKGINILGFDIPLINAAGEFDIDVGNIARTILSSLYDYTSSVFMPVWEFYDAAKWGEEVTNPGITELQQMQCQYERAIFEGTVYGKMIASVLIGDSLGTGNYPASFGFQNLNEVRQMMYDLTYLPTFYPLLFYRDSMLMFAGLVILFYFLSFLAAEKEEKYASGELPVKVRKKRAKKTKSPVDEVRKDIASLTLVEMGTPATTPAVSKDEPTLTPIDSAEKPAVPPIEGGESTPAVLEEIRPEIVSESGTESGKDTSAAKELREPPVSENTEKEVK